MRISDWSSDVCSSDLHSTPAGRELILDACPEPDILVATCSPPPYTPDWRGITSEDWRSGIETGLLSPIEFTNAVVGGMIARGWGRIVHIATGAAKYPHVLPLLSGAPRAALVNYAVAMATVLARHGVTVTTMLPVMPHTPGIRAIYEAQAQARGTSYDIEVARMEIGRAHV